jgi:mono/diheme cytochrome c family protein
MFAYRGPGLVLLLLLGVALIVPVKRSDADAKKPDAVTIVVDNGLSDDDRKEFYRLAEGSEIIPSDWLGALQSIKTGTLFVKDLSRFGLIEAPDGEVLDYGPDKVKLPVGLTLVDVNEKRLPPEVLGKVVGVNCASCHVTEMTYTPAAKDGAKAPVKIRIDGAPARFNVEGFYEELFESVVATVKDKALFAAFLARLDQNKNKSKISRLLILLQPHLKGIGKDENKLAAALISRVKALLDHKAPQPPADVAADIAALYRSILTAPLDKRKDLVQALLKKQKDAIPGADVLRSLANEKPGAVGALASALAGIGVEELAILEARLVFLKRLRALHAPGVPQFPPGPGRVDAFVTARNLLFDPEDNILATSPVRFPALWVLGPKPDPKFWLHWDGNTNSMMERNIGQSLGLGAVADPTNFWSTVRPKDLHTLEGYARKLKPPQWPKAFGAVDSVSKDYENGKKLYQTYCAGCHDFKPGDALPPGAQKAPQGGVVFSLKAIGTDPERANNFARRLHPMKGESDAGPEFAAKLGTLLTAIKKQAYKDNGISEKEEASMDLPQAQIRWQTTVGYVARPLSGVWARAPYLHNGSVPTLDDLLKPASQRPWVFPVGHSEYDPIKVGYVSSFAEVPLQQRANVFLFDTRLKGNSNAGHEGKEYGTELSDEDRRALLTYLKTLGG